MIMARKRQSSQELRELFDSVSTPEPSDEDEIADDNFDMDFSDCDGDNDDITEDLVADVSNCDDDVNLNDSEDENSIADEEENVEGRSVERAEGDVWLYAQNKKFTRKWSSNPPNVTRTRDFLILRETEGLTAHTAQNLTTPLLAFQQCIPDTLVNVIVAETNRKARQFYTMNSKTEKGHRVWYDTSSVEICALFGILIYAGLHKNWDERLDELYRLDNRPFYRAVMSLQRVQQLLRFLRFDNYQTRHERLKTDKLAAFRDVWNMFLANIRAPYKPSANLTIDEQLVLTRGRCSFRQYIPSKPGKYGIKIFWICDAKNSYPLKAEVYVGKQPNESRSIDYALNLVHRISASFLNKGRTITMDNFFTSCILAEQLLQKKTTIIGTIRHNKPDLLREFTNKAELKKRELNSSQFCFDNNLTSKLLSKKNKNVLLLSTLHSDAGVDSSTQIPNIVLDYNATKSGVDNLDKLVKTYTCKRKTKRWPMVLFFNIVDVAGVAAYKLHKSANPQLYTNPKSSERKIFLKELAMQLVQKNVLQRLSNPRALKKNVKTATNLIGYKIINLSPTTKEAVIPAASKRSRCYLCPRSADIKTKSQCHLCNQPSCPSHTKILCTECVKEDEHDSTKEDNFSGDASE